MSTWQVRHVWALWGFRVVRMSGGGVYAGAARARTRSAKYRCQGANERIKVGSWYPGGRRGVKEVGEDGAQDLRPGPDRSSKRTGDLGADRKSTRLNSSHVAISYAVFCLKKKKRETT